MARMQEGKKRSDGGEERWVFCATSKARKFPLSIYNRNRGNLIVHGSWKWPPRKDFRSTGTASGAGFWSYTLGVKLGEYPTLEYLTKN